MKRYCSQPSTEKLTPSDQQELVVSKSKMSMAHDASMQEPAHVEHVTCTMIGNLAELISQSQIPSCFDQHAHDKSGQTTRAWQQGGGGGGGESGAHEHASSWPNLWERWKQRGRFEAGCMAAGGSRVCMCGGSDLCLLCSLCARMRCGCRSWYIGIPLQPPSRTLCCNAHAANLQGDT